MTWIMATSPEEGVSHGESSHDGPRSGTLPQPLGPLGGVCAHVSASLFSVPAIALPRCALMLASLLKIRMSLALLPGI